MYRMQCWNAIREVFLTIDNNNNNRLFDVVFTPGHPLLADTPRRDTSPVYDTATEPKPYCEVMNLAYPTLTQGISKRR